MKSSLFSLKSTGVGGKIVAVSAALILLFQIVLAQRPRREAADKGPRAMGLLQFTATGKVQLLPITIMVEGKFYDASAYKASPVPIALETGTVYEALRSGVSQGIFTVSSALQGATWRGIGKWQSAAELQADAAKKKTRDAARHAKKSDDQDQDGPPVLRRAPSSEGGSAAEKSKPAPTAATTNKDATPAKPKELSASSSANDDDPDRPALTRSNTVSESNEKVDKPTGKSQGAKSPAMAIGPSPEPQLVPAISDAGGPEPHSYIFDIKPEEESKFRTKMLAMAALEVGSRANPNHEVITSLPRAPRKARPAKLPQPVFENIRLHVFDLSTNNEPVVVLTANAHMPKPADATQYLITLVAREDIYGDLHKALANLTDGQHMDVSPRLDLIDAVDVDGDGRGELLFHQVYDRGAAYVVYRVIGNQLWPLFQGAVL